MKSLQKLTFFIALAIIITSCGSANQALSNPDTKMDMMNQIANDSTMAKEMIAAMMNSQNGKMLMQQHQTMMMGDNITMMQMMQDNPTMMSKMMASMMETAKGDTTMIAGMCNTLMSNKEMMTMMQKMDDKNMEAMRNRMTIK